MRDWLMDRRIRRSNKKALAFLNQERIALLRSGKSDLEGHAEIRRQVEVIRLKSKVFETRILLEKAIRLGIDIPNQKGWWKDDDEYTGTSPTDMLLFMGDRHLTDLGKAGITRLIREERRKKIEWWIKSVILPITALIGALIALLTWLNK